MPRELSATREICASDLFAILVADKDGKALAEELRPLQTPGYDRRNQTLRT
jgi:hypothetical protein